MKEPMRSFKPTFRYSTRLMLIAVTLLSICLAAFGVHLNRLRAQERAVEVLVESGCIVPPSDKPLNEFRFTGYGSPQEIVMTLEPVQSDRPERWIAQLAHRDEVIWVSHDCSLTEQQFVAELKSMNWIKEVVLEVRFDQSVLYKDPPHEKPLIQMKYDLENLRKALPHLKIRSSYSSTKTH